MRRSKHKIEATVSKVSGILRTDRQEVELTPESLFLEGDELWLYLPAPMVKPTEVLLGFVLVMGDQRTELGVDNLSKDSRDGHRLVIVQRVEIKDISRVGGRLS